MPSSRSSAARKIETGFVDAEYIPPRELPKPRKLRVVEKSTSVEKERVEHEDDKKLKDIQEQLHKPDARIVARSTVERNAALKTIERFKTYLEERDGITDRGMDAYGHQMQEISEHLHALQADAHRHPSNGSVAETMSENFKVLEELETAIRASKMEPARARAEMRFGTKVRQYEKEQEWHGEGAGQSAKEIESQIREAFGDLHPEELMAGGGWQGVKFRLKNALAHLVNGKSLYDEWRAAKSLEEAGEAANISRKAHEQQMVTELDDSDLEIVEEAPPSSRRRKKPPAEPTPEPTLEKSGEFEIPKARRRTKNDDKEGVIEIAEADRLRVIQELDEDIARTKKKAKVELGRSVPGPLKEAYEAFQEEPMTIKRAQILVPNAVDVWELVRQRAEAKPTLQVLLAKEMGRLNAPDAYSTYVFALARLAELKRNKAAKKRVDEAAKLVDSLSAALEITPENIVSMTTPKPVEPEKPKAVKDTLRGTRQRKADVSRQEQRRKF